MLGLVEVAVILAIVLALFGAGRFAELGAAYGKTVRSFRAALRGEDAPPDKK
jgi:sec-independent protein translocase protein TatA